MNSTYIAYPWGRWIKWGVIALVIIIVASLFGGTYNSLVQANQRVKSTWSQVENAMQRRSDAIINMVETVKGEVQLEKDIIDKITAARSVVMDKNASKADKINADSQMRSIVVLMEDNPEIKAHESFENLQVLIEGAENRVYRARMDYNEAVEAYNTKVTRFPGSIFARLMGFKEMDYFEASPDAKETPKVKF
ncbi:LemA family protein [Clostridium thermosuccinogenes]|uniref:LemA family protein n=1 Tax=Clostridium thermosuccinogenes TaxID=84032 RepID=UPI00137983BC|nr:LemA family protein [Pseudoclostridium thermosuccinogenes]